MVGVKTICMEATMDFIFLGGIALCFALTVGLACGCQRLGGGVA